MNARGESLRSRWWSWWPRVRRAGLVVACVTALGSATLLLLAGLFQVSDGLQLGCSGALRGYQDARVPLAIVVASYWGIGFTLAWVFGIVRGEGAPGVWFGLIAGLTAAGLLLAVRFFHISARRIER